jgi:hypothetical protein
VEPRSKEITLWSDAWVLLASLWAMKEDSQAAALEDVIAAADVINHAIVTFEEMEGALARLTAGGFLEFSDGHLRPTDRTLGFYGGIQSKHRSTHRLLSEMEQFLGVIPWSPGQDSRAANAGVSFPALSRAAFDSAVKAYHQSWKRRRRT